MKMSGNFMYIIYRIICFILQLPVLVLILISLVFYTIIITAIAAIMTLCYMLLYIVAADPDDIIIGLDMSRDDLVSWLDSYNLYPLAVLVSITFDLTFLFIDAIGYILMDCMDTWFDTTPDQMLTYKKRLGHGI